MLDSWEDVFDPSPVPKWLVRFDGEPTRAVDDLLFESFYHGHLQPAEPADLVIAWVRLLGDTGDFAERLDGELRAWVERYWGGVPEPRDVDFWADAWARVANVVAVTDELKLTTSALRERFDTAHEALGPFSTSPSRDPLGRYLWAMAEHQDDRSLAQFWWSMCDLDDGVPFYHARYALEGVAGLPPPPGKEGGGFPEDVVHAVLRLGRAFDRLRVRRRLQEKQAAKEYRHASRWGVVAFPFPERWCEVLAPRLRHQPEWVGERLVEVVHGLDRLVERPPRLSRGVNWKEQTDRVVAKLKTDLASARVEIEKHLAEQRALAETTGDAKPLVRSLCRFASTVASSDAEQAIVWAEEALTWEPWDAYSWTTLMKAQLRGRHLDEALVTAWQAVERFPQNEVARTGLGEVLKAQQRLDEAEHVYRQTVERFPTNVVARNGLGEVLKAQQRLDEAEDVYRQTVERFPTNVYAKTGLESVLKLKPDVETTGTRESEPSADPLTPTLRSRPAPPTDGLSQGRQASAGGEGAPTAPEETERTASAGGEGAPTAPEETAWTAASEVRETPAVPASRRDVRPREAALLRHAARRAETAGTGPSPTTLRERAGKLLEEVLRERPYDVRALTEKGLLRIDSGAFEAARTLLAEHAGRLPAAPLLWASLGRALREEARGGQRRLDPETESEVLEAPRHLHELDHAYEPLVRLQEGRAYLALTDGDQRLQGASRAFDRLRRWVVHHQDDERTRDFEPWYSAELRRYALADIDDKIEPPDVEAIAARLDENARFADALEEDFVLRFA